MNIRRSLPIVLVPLLALAATACGDDKDDSPAAQTTADGSAPSTEGAETTTPSDGDSATTVAETDDTATTAGDTATTSADDEAAAVGSITVGSADFSESQLLAQIYGQALASSGFDVDYKLAIGSREIYFGAIESGEIDLVPEYTNSLLTFLVRRDDPDAPLPEAANVEEQLAALAEILPDGLEVLTPSTAEDKDVIVCTAEAAETYGLTTLSDLGANAADIRLGAPPEFETRSPFGLVGFAEIYGADEFKEFVPLAPGAIADALSAGEIDCGNLFSTLPVITTSGWVALEDDKVVVPNEAVLPLVRSEVVTPELTDALDEVNAALDTETLKELMVKVDGDAQAPDVVAEEWLATLD